LHSNVTGSVFSRAKREVSEADRPCHEEPKLSMSGAIPPLKYTNLWHAQG